MGDTAVVLPAKLVTAIDVNIAFEIPTGIFAKIESQSSMARKGVNVVGGVCDAGYTGNIIVQLQNMTNNDIALQKNDKIAQVIFHPLVQIEKLQRVEKREELQASSRQEKGFGSSDQQQLQAEQVSPTFSIGEVTTNQKKQLEALLEEYADLFNKELGRCGIVKHEIDTGQE